MVVVDWVGLGLGSAGGAFFSEALKFVIEESKKYRSFKPLSKDLVSTMERLLPLTKKIDSMQKELDLDAWELKKLWQTIERACVLVLEFPSVRFYEKSIYARRITEIDEEMAKFCGIDLQLLQYKNQLTLLGVAGNLVDKVDRLNKRMDGLMSGVPPPVPVFRDRCSVPKIDKISILLDWPFMELKKILLDEAVVNLVVSDPLGCGTTLAYKLCHDTDMKGHFKHIFFTVVANNTAHFAGIVQNLLQHNGFAPRIFENDSQATVGLRKVLEKLREDGPILLVLDDVWRRGAESTLQKFRITFPYYKILVTCRFDIPSFGYNYRLKRLGDGDARALLIHCASRPDKTSDKEYEVLLQKILKHCHGVPTVIELVGAALNGKSLTTWREIATYEKPWVTDYSPVPKERGWSNVEDWWSWCAERSTLLR